MIDVVGHSLTRAEPSGARGRIAEARASFLPEPLSVRGSRALLREFLGEAGRLDLVDHAELPLSEVVTNAVLHAHTEFDVALRLDARALRVDVVDTSPHMPMAWGYGVNATTGRGMSMIAMLATTCGVERRPGGKSVWFVVPAQPESRGAEEVGTPWDVDLATTDPRWSGRVELLAMPPRLWLAAREHHDALMRELALYSAAHPDGAAPHQRAVADEARGWISQGLVAALHERGVEVHHGAPLPLVVEGLPDTMDLTLAVGADASAAFAMLQDVLDIGEDLAVRAGLLTRPGLPEVIAVRDWACEQAIAQAGHVTPTPWPGTSREHFTTEVNARSDGRVAGWDASVVTTSEEAVIASDEANRIIAVSAPLAQALGWDPQDLVGRRVIAIIPPRYREAHVAGFSRHMTTGRATIIGHAIRMPALRRDGTEIDAIIRIEDAGLEASGVYLAWINPQ